MNIGVFQIIILKLDHFAPVFLGFYGGSDGKESACSVGDLGSISCP